MAFEYHQSPHIDRNIPEALPLPIHGSQKYLTQFLWRNWHMTPCSQQFENKFRYFIRWNDSWRYFHTDILLGFRVSTIWLNLIHSWKRWITRFCKFPLYCIIVFTFVPNEFWIMYLLKSSISPRLIPYACIYKTFILWITYRYFVATINACKQ